MLNDFLPSKLAIGILIMSITLSCKKETVSDPETDPTKKFTDYGIYDLEQMASASGSSIADTIWDNKKERIIGFKLDKKAKNDFQYPIQGFDKAPLINSFISLKYSPTFNLDKYKIQSGAMVPRILINTSEPGFYTSNIAITSWEDVDKLIKNRVEQLKEDRTGTRDFVFSFHDYENLQLLFGENVAIKKLFHIEQKNYPALKNKGVVYYYERSTVSLNSLFEDQDLAANFSVQTLRDDNMARVNQVKFGKIGYMVLDASEGVRALISKITSTNDLSSKEVADINRAEVYFLLRGFEKTNIDKISQATTTFEKIKEFKKLLNQTSYDSTNIGVPLYYSLKSHSKTLEIFNSTSFNRQINFIQ
jgi:hypothetical protein